MALKDDNINATLNINGNPARNEMIKLQESTQKLEKRNADLELSMKKLEAQGLKGTKIWEIYEQELKENEKTVKANNKAHKELYSQLNINEKTMAELRKEARSLRAQLANTVPSDPNWKKLDRQYKDIIGRMQQMGEANKSLCDTFNTMRGVIGANLVRSGFNFLISKFASKIYALSVQDFSFYKSLLTFV
jgi:chromosome segregation ATPase